jgi:ClpP class serine protease
MSENERGSASENPKGSDPFTSGYDFLLVNGPIDDRLLADVIMRVTEDRSHNKLVLALVTYGGTANVGYQIARYLQTVYDEIVAFVPSICKSAKSLDVARD